MTTVREFEVGEAWKDLADNALRIGRLLDILGTRAEPAAPLRMLDAGCGTGWLTRALASFGHRVDGIDPSEASMGACRRQARADGRDRYAVSSLETWAPPFLYDVVTCVDGSRRLTDDALWEASVVNLASLVRLGGRLVLGDREDRFRGSGVDGHAVDGHSLQVLGHEGLVYRRFVPFELLASNSSDVGFHLFDRIT